MQQSQPGHATQDAGDQGKPIKRAIFRQFRWFRFGKLNVRVTGKSHGSGFNVTWP
jgi:hypothetical protein